MVRTWCTRKKRRQLLCGGTILITSSRVLHYSVQDLAHSHAKYGTRAPTTLEYLLNSTCKTTRAHVVLVTTATKWDVHRPNNLEAPASSAARDSQIHDSLHRSGSIAQAQNVTTAHTWLMWLERCMLPRRPTHGGCWNDMNANGRTRSSIGF
ncbi:hypothetical protein BS17DRAFT_787636 [Gyrodon lividus]|nr:hypothetical protein BS17DRAFT_787636 [Gyrodon lividus]